MDCARCERCSVPGGFARFRRDGARPCFVAGAARGLELSFGFEASLADPRAFRRRQGRRTLPPSAACDSGGTSTQSGNCAPAAPAASGRRNWIESEVARVGRCLKQPKPLPRVGIWNISESLPWTQAERTRSLLPILLVFLPQRLGPKHAVIDAMQPA